MENWKFSELEYIRPDIEAEIRFNEEMAGKVRNASSYEEVRKALMTSDEHDKKLMSMYTVMHIRHTLNTKDEFYEKENDVM